ncbi:MAG: (2Fe-2S)-binding protein [Pseudomonadales bacterium]
MSTSGQRLVVRLTVNGVDHELLLEARTTLLQALRLDLGLTGTKIGCDHGNCGACTVLVGERPQYACLRLAVDCGASAITTVEGLAAGERLHPVQQAFIDADALQCGFCTPGQVMSAVALLNDNPAPDDAEIDRAMSGNLCRCGAYPHIREAVRRAADTIGS